MNRHPAIESGRAAVITGAADGVGLAAAQTLAGLGLNVVMADLDGDKLEAAGEVVRRLAHGGVETAPTDVADFEQLVRLKERALARFGDVAVLMNNAGIGGGWARLRKPGRLDPAARCQPGRRDQRACRPSPRR